MSIYFEQPIDRRLYEWDHRFSLIEPRRREPLLSEVSPDDFFKAAAWCGQNIGPRGVDWYPNYMGDIHIREAQHAFAFKLRWC